MGNRTYPYSAKEAKEVLAGNFSATVDFPEEEDCDLPSVTLYHSATENMRKTVDLPHMCEKQQIRKQMKGSSQMLTGNLLEKTATTSKHTKGYQSTGRWGLQRKQK